MSTAPSLFATPATVQAIERAPAVAALIGSYDGSGNYGDIAQAEAALELVGRLEPTVLPLPVLERGYRDSHLELAAESSALSRHALFFGPQGEGARDDGLLPVAAPRSLVFAATYLYGGGYLNRSWGARKLAMLKAAESLLEAGGAAPAVRLASGQQVEAGWLDELDEGDRALLASFDLLGARDPESAGALESLGASRVLLSGDDAVGVLASAAASAGSGGDGPLRLNLHLTEHEWALAQPQAASDFFAPFLTELGRIAGRRPIVQPLIAYLDRRIDERPALGRLDGAGDGFDLLEPLVLRPGHLRALAPRLGEAGLTLSCSYHVALTSLMLGVPALLLGDNPYYRQKAAGLAHDFGPGVFSLATTADPLASAQAIAAAALAGDSALPAHLDSAAQRLGSRRTAVEADLLAALAAPALTALTERVDELAGRLRRRSAEPAEQEARLAALQTELEELRLRASASPFEAELRAQQAESRLGEILDSRSWRLTAFLRRLGAFGRRASG